MVEIPVSVVTPKDPIDFISFWPTAFRDLERAGQVEKGALFKWGEEVLARSGGGTVFSVSDYRTRCIKADLGLLSAGLRDLVSSTAEGVDAQVAKVIGGFQRMKNHSLAALRSAGVVINDGVSVIDDAVRGSRNIVGAALDAFFSGAVREASGLPVLPISKPGGGGVGAAIFVGLSLGAAGLLAWNYFRQADKQGAGASPHVI